MKIKMIVTDLDGTLLRNNETISQYSLDVLRRCRDTGIKVIYATGRGERSANGVAPSGYFDGKIAQAGAKIVAGQDVVSKCIIPKEKARGLLVAFEKYGICAMADDGNLYYGSEKTFDYVVVEINWTRSSNYYLVTDVSTIDIDFEKICVFLSTSDEKEFVKSQLTDDLYLTMSRDGSGMIMFREATKINGIMKLAEHWNITREEIIAFGDDLIDVEMLKQMGIGVAMANAIPEAKAAAYHICGSNEEDGVARWLEENIL